MHGSICMRKNAIEAQRAWHIFSSSNNITVSVYCTGCLVRAGHQQNAYQDLTVLSSEGSGKCRGLETLWHLQREAGHLRIGLMEEVIRARTLKGQFTPNPMKIFSLLPLQCNRSVQIVSVWLGKVPICSSQKQWHRLLAKEHRQTVSARSQLLQMWRILCHSSPVHTYRSPLSASLPLLPST